MSGWTAWNVSFAVWPMRSLSCLVSCRPGNCTRMRSEPWRTTVDSAVPMALTRRLTVSMAALEALATRCCMPCWVGASVIVSVPELSTVRSLPPEPRMAVPIGWISFLRAAVALSRSSGLVTFTCTVLPTTPRPVKPILASRSVLRVSSRSVLSQSFSSSLVSMASNRCAPPRRSRPSGSCLCGTHLGQLSTVSLEKKFGIVKSTPARHVRTMAMIFQRSKCNICRPISFAFRR